jgi:cysteine desulfurase/selenocysteine lyase
MIAEGRVTPERVEYNALPWEFAAGTPNILGTIASAQAVRLLLDLSLTPERRAFFRSPAPVEWSAVGRCMARITAHTRRLTEAALERLRRIPGLTVSATPPGGVRSSPSTSAAGAPSRSPRP